MPAYLLASYVGYTRIEARKHDIYDVIGGATIAVISAYIFVKPFKNKQLSFNLTKSGNLYCFGINYRY